MDMGKEAPRALARIAFSMFLVAGALPAIAQTPLPADVTSAVRKAYGDGDIHYLDRSVDLNGDGRPEIVLYLAGPTVCGTGGCTLLVFTPRGSGWRLVGSTSVTRTPIRASPARSAGWRHLIVHVAGGGGPTGDVELRFTGRSYPGNPSVPGPHVKPAVLEGAELLIDDFGSLQDTRLLPAAGASAPTPRAGPVPPTVTFRCQGLEGQPMTAVFYAMTEPPTAVLTVGDRQVVAFVARSGSGARYTAPGVEFWEHQGEASLQWFGKTYACKAP